MTDSRLGFPCPNYGCKDGEIEVWNAYSDEPLVPSKQKCEVCLGEGFVLITDEGQITSAH